MKIELKVYLCNEYEEVEAAYLTMKRISGPCAARRSFITCPRLRMLLPLPYSVLILRSTSNTYEIVSGAGFISRRCLLRSCCSIKMKAKYLSALSSMSVSNVAENATAN